MACHPCRMYTLFFCRRLDFLMSEMTALWVVLGFLATVLGFFARYFIRKIDDLSQGRSETELASMKAMDGEREKAWWEWRHSLERRFERIERRLFNGSSDR